MATYILNKYNAAKFQLEPTIYNVMIRVTSPSDQFIELKNKDIYRDILELKFYDFVNDQSGLLIFNMNHMEKILNFFEKHKFCRNIVIHCDQGMSRSAGIAVGWFLFNDDRSSIYKLYHSKKYLPNRLIVEHFYKHYKKSMKYIDKWEKERFQNLTGGTP